jgi:hypothetical protein
MLDSAEAALLRINHQAALAGDLVVTQACMVEVAEDLVLETYHLTR